MNGRAIVCHARMPKEFCKVFYFYEFFFIGGSFCVSVKHQTGVKVRYTSGFFITTNVYPDFRNQSVCDAIRKRLSVFNTKSLKKKDGGVTGILYNHCCVSKFIYSLTQTELHGSVSLCCEPVEGRTVVRKHELSSMFWKHGRCL